MKYFARIDKKQVGPLSLTELVKAGVRPSTWVWAKGMSDWQRAEDVPEICRAMRRVLAGCNPETGESFAEKKETAVNQTNPEEAVVPQKIYLHNIPEQPDSQDYSLPPRNVSIIYAILLTILCFPFTGIVAIWFAMKSKADWKQSQVEGLPPKDAELWRRKAHDDARIYRMMLGITFFMGIIVAGFTFMRTIG